jgi:hypothetical protein
MANSAAPLLLAGGAALLLMSGKKKKKNGNGKPKCPPVVHIRSSLMPRETIEVDYDDGTKGEITLEKAAYFEAVGGNRDIIDITSKVLAPFIPESCISSESIKVDFVDSDAKTTNYSAVEFFYLMSMDILEDFYQAGLFSEEELQFSGNQMLKWWVEHMGEAPVPKV